MGLGGEVHMAPEKVVDRDVPLAREFEPGLPWLDHHPPTATVRGVLYQSHEFHQSE